jgi:cbb3-type cytochrome oxidase maturation protein
LSVLFVLVPAALLLVAAAIVAFSWAARRGQFDDMSTPALRMLHDDDPPRDQD